LHFLVCREKAMTALDNIRQDLLDAVKTLEQSEQRVEENIGTKARERVLSVADRSAAFIAKGEREPTIGYKPQLARSGQGFVTALIVESGNGSDSKALVPMVQRCIEKTGIIPESVSVDDGYASASGVEKVGDLGVAQVSVSGAKGKKLLEEKLWDDPVYTQLRADRSAVESLMYVLKYSYEFGRMGRRGLEAVQSEMVEKILAYNFARAVKLRRQRPLEPPAIAV